MKIHLAPIRNEDLPISKGLVFTQVPKVRPQDTFVTMAGSKSVIDKVKGFFKGSWNTFSSFFSTSWEWIYWIIRLCPSENTRMEYIDSIVEDPNAAGDDAKNNPAEFIGGVIAATLINPEGVDEKRTQNRNEVGKFVRKFKADVTNREAVIEGKNGILQKIVDALGIFKGLKPDQVFVKFLLERPALIAGAMKSYCKKALSEIEEIKMEKLSNEIQKEVKAIQVALQYFEKVADRADKTPTDFKNFITALFSKSSFNFEEIRNAADKHLEDFESTTDEKAAFKTCSENNHQALYRLSDQPTYLGFSKDVELGTSTLYGSLLAQLSSNDFTALSGLMKEDFSLGAEVCEHLADIAKIPSQFKKVCNNFHRAWGILRLMYSDYSVPPSVSN